MTPQTESVCPRCQPGDESEAASPSLFVSGGTLGSAVKAARRRKQRAWIESVAFACLLVVSTIVAFEVDLFEWLMAYSRAHESWELDEVFSSAIVISILVAIFAVRRLIDLASVLRNAETIERQRQAEWTRLCDAIEAVDAGFSLWDANNHLVLCNKRYRKMFPEIDRVIRRGNRLDELMSLHKSICTGARPDPGHLHDGEEGCPTIEASGSAIVQHPQGNWIRCNDRKITDGGTVSLRTDVTEMKERELQLERAALDAERHARDLARLADELRVALKLAENLRLDAETANLAKSRFLATMSHELRTPLNAIIGFAEIIKDRALGDQRTDTYFDYAGDIRESGVHLLQLINQILDLSKIEAGTIDLRITEVDLRRVLPQCLDMVQGDMGKKGLRPRVELAGDPQVFLADEICVKQILFNVLSNAVKYTRDPGEIGIASRWDEDGGFEIRVTDHGLGIPKEEIPRLLRPFERMDSSYTSATSGTGLGLAVVRSLMEHHGGTVELHSELGSGTTVVLHFPHRVDYRRIAAPEPRQAVAAG
ncbi:MAG: PAS-domain containing protein [Rhodospirillaceae bacterium]|nr:PAS-domain containing protein [Rhodospirillaceae bacterium]